MTRFLGVRSFTSASMSRSSGQSQERLEVCGIINDDRLATVAIIAAWRVECGCGNVVVGFSGVEMNEIKGRALNSGVLRSVMHCTKSEGQSGCCVWGTQMKLLVGI